MDNKTFEFGEDYNLVVTDKGFSLYDIKTGELLVDASILDSYWPVEIDISGANRDFYITSGIKNSTQFGFSKRK